MADIPQRPDLDSILSSDLRAFVNDILHEEGGIDHFRELLSDDQLAKLESRRKLELVTRSGVIFTRERNISNILETPQHRSQPDLFRWRNNFNSLVRFTGLC